MKSPGGSNFPYYYKNGIIHAVKLGNFKKDEKRLLFILEKEKEFIIRQSETSCIWIDLYSTKISKNVFVSLITFLDDISIRIKKCALVGTSFLDRIRLMNRMNSKIAKHIKIEFYKDPEEAKTWLVS